MRKSRIRRLVVVIVLVGAGAYVARGPGLVDAASLTQDAAGPTLRVAILAAPNDPRIPVAREAIAHWNQQFARLGRTVHFDSVIVRSDTVPDALLQGASSTALLSMGPGPSSRKLVASLSNVPADVVIALSHADFISFSVRWREGSKGVVGIKRADTWPLSLPNAVRNVIAHETGHVLGLDHNTDPTTLMCGRPSSCRPDAFASDTPRFFPLTAADEARLKKRWP